MDFFFGKQHKILSEVRNGLFEKNLKRYQLNYSHQISGKHYKVMVV